MPTTNEHGQPVGEEVPGWQGAEPVRPVELEGRYARLEPISASHADPLHAAVAGAGDEPLWTYRPDTRPTDVAAFARDLVASLAGDTGSVTWAVVPTGRAAEGMVTLQRAEPGHGSVEVAGILWGRSLQRTPAATEAVHLLARHVFEDLGYRRLEWKCDALNAASAGAALRLGFEAEGVFRQHLVVKGRSRDTAWFSLLDAAWPGVRAAQEAWLDPGNFDEDGRQRRSLRQLLGAPS